MGVGNVMGTLVIENIDGFIKAIEDAPKVQLRFMRGELSRGVKRIRKSFIRTQLQGPPGINATGRLSKGKNVFTFTGGESLSSIHAKIGISRILHVHEVGMTIAAKSGALLIHAQGRGRITAAVPQVVIPPRLKFRQQVAAESPAMLVKVGKAGTRATEVTLRKGLSLGAL